MTKKKTVDTEIHNILLDKLNYYGFREISNQWFSSYLSIRTQTTEIGSHISGKLNINCGVPQGSVLGPLLFLRYVNDIQYCSRKLQLFLFADDTNSLYAHKDLKILEPTVNAELRNLYNCQTKCWGQNLEWDTSNSYCPKKAFKRSLKATFLDILQIEDSDILM